MAQKKKKKNHLSGPSDGIISQVHPIKYVKSGFLFAIYRSIKQYPLMIADLGDIGLNF